MAKKKTGVDRSSFKYVDARTGATGWSRREITDIPKFIVEHNYHDVYCTIQRYALKTKNKGEDEPMLAPLFFDFDSKRTTLQLIDQGWITVQELGAFIPDSHRKELEKRELGQPFEPDVLEIYSIDPNEEKDSPYVRHFSEDLKMYIWKVNIDIAREDAVKITQFFREFGLDDDEIRVWFSGMKGFHVTVHEDVVGIEPGVHLHQQVKHMAVYLEELLSLKTLDKASIYGKGRMWRIPNTVHHKSGKYKTEVSHTELERGDIDYILEISKTPRGPLYSEAEQYFELNASLNEWYKGHVTDWEEARKAVSTTVSTHTLSALQGMDDFPVCVKYIVENSPELMRATGTNRNAITYRLATYYKSKGASLQEAYDAIVEWAMSLPRDVSTSSAQEKRANTMSAVKAVYENDNYNFSCASMRSIGKKNAKDKTIVPCAGRACPVHEDHGLDEIEPTKAHLADTARAEYVGQKVSFDCLVSGKLDTPYQVPKKVEFFCHHMNPEKAICQTCVLMDHNGSFEREFHENDRFLIEAVGQPDNNLKGILRKHSHANCEKVQYRALEYVNVSEVMVVPMAERVVSIKVNDDDVVTALDAPVDDTGKEYVSRRVYAIGADIASNAHYEFTGYVYPHPKNQLATVLSQTQIPKQDTISDFKMSEGLGDAFKVFQVQQGEKLGQRLDLIISDIVGNVTKVRQRNSAHLAALMTYHSVLKYYFMPDELEARGWMELCIVGDSGQAKTLLISRLQEFCGLGELVGGETAGRTGLLYSLQQMGDRWFISFGKYPLNDRKLLAIDEFSGLSESDFEQMTESRETGVLRVTRIINTETNARTRLIFMSNPRNGKQLAEFSYGVESLKSLYREAADIRRLDLAIFLKSGDVPQSVLNSRFEKPKVQVIRPEVMKMSVLWAWSRNENQIVIEKKAMDKILKAATDLGDKYGAAVDIPLLEPATLRKKLARMSIALAALVHSTDEKHEKIIVKPEHVEYVAYNFLDTLYSFKNCRLDVYAAKAKNESILTQEETDKVMNELASGDFVENAYATREVLDLFRKNDVLRAQEILDMTGLERATVNSRLNLLQRYSMIKRTREGMRKLPKFIEFLEVYFNEEG